MFVFTFIIVDIYTRDFNLVCRMFCAVNGCSSVIENNPDLQFFLFPKNEALLQMWVKACGLEEWKININKGN